MHKFVEQCNCDCSKYCTALRARKGVPVWVLEFEDEFFADGRAYLDGAGLER